MRKTLKFFYFLKISFPELKEPNENDISMPTEWGLSLNSDIMHLILGFLDPVDCGKISQISKGWRKFVYRSQVWNRFNWRVTTDFKVLGLTDKSVHCGVKRRDCFWLWVSRNYKFHDGGVLSIQTLWRMWLKQGSPCISLYHHIPETCFIYPLPASEREKFLKHHVIYGSPNVNPYYQFVNRMSRIVWAENGGAASIHWIREKEHLENLLVARKTVAEAERKSIQHLEIAALKNDIDELQKIINEYYRIYNIFRLSLNKLCLITNSSFNLNHVQVINHNNPLWNNVIFSLPP